MAASDHLLAIPIRPGKLRRMLCAVYCGLLLIGLSKLLGLMGFAFALVLARHTLATLLRPQALTARVRIHQSAAPNSEIGILHDPNWLLDVNELDQCWQSSFLLVFCYRRWLPESIFADEITPELFAALRRSLTIALEAPPRSWQG